MFRKIYIPLYFIIFQINFGNCQTIDSAYLKCAYRLKYLVDSTKPDKPMTDVFNLLIGKTRSEFYSYTKFSEDSSFNDNLQQGTIREFLKDPKQSNAYGSSGFYSNYQLFIGYPGNKITITDMIAGSKFLYEEDMEKIGWIISGDTITMGEYHCQKAFASFKGRKYEAWFTPDIPISAGPYKFYGLPGLVIKIADIKGNYIFECISVEKLSNKSPIVLDKKYCIKTSRTEFRAAFQSMFDNPLEVMAHMSNGANNIPAGLKTRFSKGIPYNPIELE